MILHASSFQHRSYLQVSWQFTPVSARKKRFQSYVTEGAERCVLVKGRVSWLAAVQVNCYTFSAVLIRISEICMLFVLLFLLILLSHLFTSSHHFMLEEVNFLSAIF